MTSSPDKGKEASSGDGYGAASEVTAEVKKNKQVKEKKSEASSSRRGGAAPEPAAEVKNNQRKENKKAAVGGASSSTAAAAGDDGDGNKTVMVRMSQSQIDLFLSFKVESVERDPLQCKEMDKILAEMDKFEKELLEDQRMVKEQYEKKGYVEYEVDARLLPAKAPPRPGWRRARHGVIVKKKP